VVAAAGLLARSLGALQSIDTGLPLERLALLQLQLPQSKYAEPGRHLRLLEDLVARLETTPGIEGATPVNSAPFGGGWLSSHLVAEGQDPAAATGQPRSLNFEAVHPGYFATLQVPLVRGRAFAETDRGGAPEVAIVSHDLAARLWPGQDPIGKRVKLGSSQPEPWRTVVGVSRAVGYRELTAARATLYLPAPQFIVSAYALVVRTSAPLSLVAPLARDRVRAADPEVQVVRVSSFADLIQAPLARPRFNAVLLGLFGLAALVLTTLGLYALLGASVRQRYAELGVRVALGASPSDLRRLVVGEGLRLAGQGAVLGLAAAALLGGTLRGLLHGVHPLDPVSLVGAALLIVAGAAAACWLPVRLATRVDPLAVLRAQ
jgi:predicted permease